MTSKSYKPVLIPTVFLAVAMLVSVIARFCRTHSKSALETCVQFLCAIDGCKQQWAIEHHASSNAVPTWDDLYVYVKSGKSGGEPFLQCPSGRTYTIGRICDSPSCSIRKHTARFLHQASSNPPNEPALDEARVLAIARAAVATNDTWLDRAEFETPELESDGSWVVSDWRLPKTPGGNRVITVDPKGLIRHYVRTY
jgi:hypothetical protein